jgi:5-methylcytosine-specific restriction protein A
MLKPAIAVADLRIARPREKRVDPELSTQAHKQWAADVKARAGYRCEEVENGRRCEVRAPARLFADHIVERKDGGALLDPKNGRCLCGRHHTIKTTAARTARMAEKF